MKLQEMIDQGYTLQAWAIENDPRGERRIMVQLNKKTSRGEKLYIVHAPATERMFQNVEFTEPVLLK